MAYCYWDAYYRTDSVDSGVSYFNYSVSEQSGDPDLLITNVTTAGDSFTGLASGSIAEFGSQPSHNQALTLQKTDSTMATHISEDGDEERIIYSVKVVCPPAGTSTERSVKKIKTVAEMKSQLQSHFFPDKEFIFGYIKRGHGMNGRQIQIVDEEDLADMYDEYRGCRTHINLWGKSRLPSRKRPSEVREKQPSEECSSTKKPKASRNYQGHLQKMTEVELIVEELEKRHSTSGSFSPEQLCVWAHMLHLKKHDSYDQPPNKPFFHQPNAAQKLVSTENRMSPAKRIQLRTELIEQLGKWHSLMECGAISNVQFQEMKETIVTDMKKY